LNGSIGTGSSVNSGGGTELEMVLADQSIAPVAVAVQKQKTEE